MQLSLTSQKNITEEHHTPAHPADEQPSPILLPHSVSKERKGAWWEARRGIAYWCSLHPLVHSLPSSSHPLPSCHFIPLPTPPLSYVVWQTRQDPSAESHHCCVLRSAFTKRLTLICLPMLGMAAFVHSLVSGTATSIFLAEKNFHLGSRELELSNFSAPLAMGETD